MLTLEKFLEMKEELEQHNKRINVLERNQASIMTDIRNIRDNDLKHIEQKLDRVDTKVEKLDNKVDDMKSQLDKQTPTNQLGGIVLQSIILAVIIAVVNLVLK